MAVGCVYLNVYGDGTAYTDAVPPLVEGEIFHIYSTPFAGATLDDIRVWTSFDEAIAITVEPDVELAYHKAWRNVYVDIYFSGEPLPPEPEPPKFFTKYPWLLAKAANEWRM